MKHNRACLSTYPIPRQVHPVYCVQYKLYTVNRVSKKFAKIVGTHLRLGAHSLGVQGVRTYLCIDFPFLTSDNTCIIGFFSLRINIFNASAEKKPIKHV